MTMILDVGVASRIDVDHAKLTQISTIGSLADAVLRELITLEADGTTSGLVAIPRAASTFRAAAAEFDRPPSIWDRPTVVENLVHVSAPVSNSASPVSASMDDSIKPWLVEVADALDCVSSGAPSQDAIDRVREEFSDIAARTMRSAAYLAGSQTFFA